MGETPDPDEEASEGHDVDGEALAAEIAADRRLVGERRRRIVLYIPPLASLLIAAFAIASSHPRDVVAARIIGGAAPAGLPWKARAIVVRAHPGDDGTPPLDGIELRLGGGEVHGRAGTSDDEGVTELQVDAPLPAKFDLEGKIDGAWTRLATISTDALPPLDASDGVIPLRRTMGKSSGDLVVDVAPELGALMPPEQGTAWVRVRNKDSGSPVGGARVELKGEAGIVVDPEPMTTDEAGLARIFVTLGAPPVLATVTAEKDGTSGKWTGALGDVRGVPMPTAHRVDPAVAAIEMMSSPSLRRAYFDLWKDGVRIDGGILRLDHGRGTIPLPSAVGLYDLEMSTSPQPSSSEDVAHAATWPLVVAKDAPDAWAQLQPPRIAERIAPPLGAPSTYPAVVGATLARAPLVVPHRAIVADGVPAALAFETTRIHRVRRGATFAIVGGGLVEFGLMLWLGVFSTRSRVQEELRILGGEGELDAVAGERGSRASAAKYAAIVLTAVGIVALVFAALAVMAWGLPGLSFE
ncbi:MAG: hypothetical protein ABI175_13700 [Polyangiales bacterium]